MTTRGDKFGRDGGEFVPLRPTRLVLIARAQEAIEFLISRDGFWEGTKNQFARIMGEVVGSAWLRANGDPDRELVTRVCTLTRDQELDPMVKGVLGGYVVDYAPNRGGMALIEPERELGLDQQLHLLTGDMQRQQSMRTINRRRVVVYHAAATSANHQADHELARICNVAADQIKSTGFVSETIQTEWFQLMASRGTL